jgi:hypothetical protein
VADETLVLDGEVAIFDQALRSRFDLVRQSDPSIVATPPIFIAFDVLYQASRDLSQAPLRERRLQPEDVVTGRDLVLPARRWPPMAWRRGPRCSSAATRAWSGRMRPACTAAASRARG